MNSYKCIFVSDEIHKQLKEAAKKDRRALGVYTSMLLENALKDKK